ncbi:MAG: hypothetical protein ACRC80_14845 [Waterburya sp.]
MRLLSNKDFDRKFKPIFRELELLQLKIDKKKGWFIFETHAWTQEELIKSEHISKISSILEKIGDDVKNWDKNKQLSFKEKKIYYEYKDKVDERLHATQLRIEKREGTFWEQLANSFGQLIPLLMDKLPDIISSNIPLKLLGNAITALLSGSNRNHRRLPTSR